MTSWKPFWLGRDCPSWGERQGPSGVLQSCRGRPSRATPPLSAQAPHGAAALCLHYPGPGAGQLGTTPRAWRPQSVQTSHPRAAHPARLSVGHLGSPLTAAPPTPNHAVVSRGSVWWAGTPLARQHKKRPPSGPRSGLLLWALPHRAPMDTAGTQRQDREET